MAVALQAFSQTGYHAASMDDIAAAAGVTKPVLYQHFASKMDLYLAILDASLSDLLVAGRTALRSTSDNKQRVNSMARAYFTFVSSPTGAFRLVFESDLANDPAVRERMDAADLALAREAATVISEDTGLSEHQALLIASGLQGMVQVAARRWQRDGPGDIDQDEAIELLMTLAWRGVRGFPATHPPATPSQADEPPEGIDSSYEGFNRLQHATREA